MRKQLLDEVEGLIDRHGPSRVLRAFANVCYEKSEHLLVNWGDQEEAKVWGTIGAVVETATRKCRHLSE